MADVYDALTHDQVYRPALPGNDVLRLLEEGRGTHFDAHLLDLFLSLIHEVRCISLENQDDRVPGAELTAILDA